MLPSREKLRTGLHFTDTEHAMFRGTNMHGAIVDRRNAWKQEWIACRAVVGSTNKTWGEQFTWLVFHVAQTLPYLCPTTGNYISNLRHTYHLEPFPLAY